MVIDGLDRLVRPKVSVFLLISLNKYRELSYSDFISEQKVCSLGAYHSPIRLAPLLRVGTNQ